MSRNFLFDIWPYITLGLLLMGFLVRLLRGSLAAADGEMHEATSALHTIVVWRSSLLALLAFHVLVLAFPAAMLSWNSIPVRLDVAESLAFLAGFLVLAGCARLIWLQLKGSTGPLIFEVCDAIFLVLLFLSLLSGCLVGVFDRWGSSWGAITLSPYLISLVHGRPASALVVQMPFLVRLHVFCAFCAIAAFPVTRLAGRLVQSIQPFLSSVDRAFIALARRFGSWLHPDDLAAWLWPEED